MKRISAALLAVFLAGIFSSMRDIICPMAAFGWAMFVIGNHDGYKLGHSTAKAAYQPRPGEQQERRLSPYHAVYQHLN